ncbi:MAG TPA: DUF4178 domain-containing protein [Thiolinea sp.]|nr:DUF4178 domain-containing protein [Thiolinea sp.]
MPITSDQPASYHCPNCGAELPLRFRYAKMAVCEHCDSTLFLEDDGMRLAGTRSVLAAMPSLIQLGQGFSYDTRDYLPVGHLRYRYKLGFWDEWWILDRNGDGLWLSVDEGDFVFEQPLQPERLPATPLPGFKQLQLNRSVRLLEQDWTVTERDRGHCEGFRGQLPARVTEGESFFYAHLSGPDASLLTLEYPQDGSVNVSRGYWVDPFEIRIRT